MKMMMRRRGGGEGADERERRGGGGEEMKEEEEAFGGRSLVTPNSMLPTQVLRHLASVWWHPFFQGGYTILIPP